MSGAWHVDIARGATALAALEPEWRALEARSRTATPFQSPEWLRPWWSCFGHGELWVVTARHRGTLEALLPLLVERRDGARRATLLGTGNTDRLDALVADASRASIALVVDALANALAPGDHLDCESLAPCSPLLTTPAPASWRWLDRWSEPCPVLRLPEDARGLEDILPGRLLAKLRYARRRLERAAPVRVERVTPATLPALLEALFALHGARWSARGLPGVLSEDAVRRFHARVAEGFLARGALRLSALRVAERIVAVCYAFAWRERAYYYLGGFDPAFAFASVGSLIVEDAIREAIREGMTFFDFLRGRERYKYRWGAVDEPSHRRVLRHQTSTAPAMRDDRAPSDDEAGAPVIASTAGAAA